MVAYLGVELCRHTSIGLRRSRTNVAMEYCQDAARTAGGVKEFARRSLASPIRSMFGLAAAFNKRAPRGARFVPAKNHSMPDWLAFVIYSGRESYNYPNRGARR